jgi:hypothetical protein
MKYCNRARRLLQRMSLQTGTTLPNGDLDPPQKLAHIERRQGKGSNDAGATHCHLGGGVGGLAAALALERRGAEIIVCEHSPALNEIGAGLKLRFAKADTPRAPTRGRVARQQSDAHGSGSAHSCHANAVH